MLINFLNADFTNYETAYNTFFYAYGYELAKDYAPYSYLKNDEHTTDVQFKEIIIESIIRKHQEEYYSAIQNCNNVGNSNEYIEFMLKVID